MSPNSGCLVSLTLILANLEPSTVSDKRTASTIPFSPCLTVTEVSLLLSATLPKFSSKNLGGEVLPINTSPEVTYDSGFTTPSLSKFL